MKEPTTKFDFEAAFKALDEIDLPVADSGVKANRVALTEVFSTRSKFDALFEEYYDISNPAELSSAQEARDAEIAKAKLARIEKIVDLDAESPEDILASYVGKLIIQCPQCMTLFYKKPEDVEASEEDPNTVNVNEVCQHCGNDSGYTLVGKVGEATEDEPAVAEETNIDVDSTTDGAADNTGGEEVDTESAATDGTADSTETDEEDIDLDLDITDELPAREEDAEEKTEESFTAHDGNYLTEHLYDTENLCEAVNFTDEEVREFEQICTETTREFVGTRGGIKYVLDYLASQLLVACEVAARLMARDNSSYINNWILPLANPELPEGAVDIYLAKTSEILRYMYKHITQHQSVQTGPRELTVVSNSWDAFLDEANKRYNSKGYYRAVYWLYINIAKRLKPMIDESKVITDLLKNTNSVPESLTEAAAVDLDVSPEQFKALVDELGDAPQATEGEVRSMINDMKNESVSKELTEAGLLDIFADLKDRNRRADWILKHAMVDFQKIQDFDDLNNEANKRFSTYIIIGFTDKYSNGEPVKDAPSYKNPDLVVGMNRPQEKTKYTDAEKIASGWSQTPGNGPAFIYLAKDKDDKEAAFLCEYFKGKLVQKNDQVETYYTKIKEQLKGLKKLKSGGLDNSEIDPNAENGVATEGLDKLMRGIDELHESSLETFIANSLVEAYKNVAGFRLSSCDYLNEKLYVNGTIYFASGNTRKTSYVFTEAYPCINETVKLVGLNEKLGAKQFILTCTRDKATKTLITESFKVKR